MTIEYFIDFITNEAAREHITQLAMEKDNQITPLKSIKFDGKRIYFNITDEKGNPNVNIKNINYFDRLLHSIDNFQYSFIFETKDYEVIKVHMSMEDGCSPFCYDEMTQKNYDDVVKVIPKHLDKFKGKKVLINHCTSSDTFTTFCEEIDGSALPITGSYIIKDCDYRIYYLNDVPCVKIFNQTNEDIYAVAMGVSLVSETIVTDMDFASGITLYCAGGEVKLKIME